MLMIRFQRRGRKNDPAFRILVLEKTASPKAGTYTDLLGTYNPKTKALTIAEDRLKDWMGKGAQVSTSLKNLLIEKKILDGKKESAVRRKNIVKPVEPVAEVPTAEPAPAEAPAESAPAPEASAEPAPTAEAAAESAPAQ